MRSFVVNSSISREEGPGPSRDSRRWRKLEGERLGGDSSVPAPDLEGDRSADFSGERSGDFSGERYFSGERRDCRVGDIPARDWRDRRGFDLEKAGLPRGVEGDRLALRALGLGVVCGDATETALLTGDGVAAC